ncbi:12293_t:CDS:2 [Entrophospora sp. SA101]|nr:12293_t:CDS:2 [Entrophospora sp. SA101]
MVLNKIPEELDDLQTLLIYLEQDLDVDLDNENLKVKFVNGLSLENGQNGKDISGGIKCVSYSSAIINIVV